MDTHTLSSYIKELGQLRQFKRNEYISKEGMTDQNIYWVEKGTIQIYILLNKDEQIIRFAYENEIFINLDSFFSNKPTKFYIQALKSTKVYFINKQIMINHLAKNKDFQLWWEQALVELILQQQEREIDLLTEDPKERLHRVLTRSPHLFQKIPHKYIANYLRMTPETLSRIKKY